MSVSRRGFLVGSAAALGCGTAQGAAPGRTDDFDYVVVGGGFAGVAAALAGAREGLREELQGSEFIDIVALT